MPKCPSQNIDWCFFRPVIAGNTQKLNLRLFLLIKCPGDNWLGFRFETGGRATRHGYSHVQFTRTVLNSVCPFGPKWLPTNDPAFPTAARDPLEMFLAMVVAVHGFHGGMGYLAARDLSGRQTTRENTSGNSLKCYMRTRNRNRL